VEEEPACGVAIKLYRRKQRVNEPKDPEPRQLKERALACPKNGAYLHLRKQRQGAETQKRMPRLEFEQSKSTGGHVGSD